MIRLFCAIARFAPKVVIHCDDEVDRERGGKRRRRNARHMDRTHGLRFDRDLVLLAPPFTGGHLVRLAPRKGDVSVVFR